MKDILKKIVFVGLPFGITMGSLYGIIANDLYLGIVSAIFLGAFFGFFMWLLTFILGKNIKKSSLGTTSGKEIIMEGQANHFKGKESVGGWLYLSTDELIFKSHKLNIQVHETLIPLNQIAEVDTSLTLGIVPNGLKIITVNGGVEKFVVNNRKLWVEKIKGKMVLTPK